MCAISAVAEFLLY